MSEITCVVVDDEKFSVEMLCEYVEQTPFLKLGLATTSALEAYHWLSTNPAQLCISDISMPELDGLRLVEALGNHAKFIFCTAHPHYAHTSYEFDVVDYLVKPVTYQRFLKAVHKARQVLHLPAPVEVADALYINGKVKGQVIRVPFTEIYCIESNRNYLKIHTAEDKPLLQKSIKELMNSLPTGFIRVHQSFIVNKTAIKYIEGNAIILNTGQQIPVGPTFKQAVMHTFKT
jgi:two-component system, LytTR family, response regulator